MTKQFQDAFLNPTAGVKKVLNQTVYTNLGFNLGHNLSSLENRVREEAFKRAEKNLQMAWGLGSWKLIYKPTPCLDFSSEHVLFWK